MSQGQSQAAADVTIFREAVRRFFERECTPCLDRWKMEGVVDRNLWKKAGDAGLLCAAIPDEYGGGGGSFAHEKVLVEEQARAGLNGWGNSVHSGIVAHYILQYGSDEQKLRWLPKLASGDLVAAIAMSEPGTGSDLQGVRTTARTSRETNTSSTGRKRLSVTASRQTWCASSSRPTRRRGRAEPPLLSPKQIDLKDFAAGASSGR